MSVTGMKNRAMRARLLACVSAFGLMSGQVFATPPADGGNLTINAGNSPYSTPDGIYGTDQVTVATGGVVTGSTNMFVFTGNTTAATLNNSGSITSSVASVLSSSVTGSGNNITVSTAAP